MISNDSLMVRRQAAVAPGVGQIHPVFVERAENARVWDVEGREYLDFAGGIAVLNTGHLHPRVKQAVARQLEDFSHTCFMVLGYESYVAVCEKLNAWFPGISPRSRRCLPVARRRWKMPLRSPGPIPNAAASSPLPQAIMAAPWQRWRSPAKWRPTVRAWG